MGWLADWLWRSASKNRLQASFLILSQRLCFSQNYWCMSGLEKQRANIKSAFEVWGVFVRPQLKVSTWILIGMQPLSKGDERSFFSPCDYTCVRILFRQIQRINMCCAFSATGWFYTLAAHADRAVQCVIAGVHSCVCLLHGTCLAC